MEQLLIYIGISPPECFAGFCGGVVYAISTKQTRPGPLVGAVILGALTANYIGVMVATYIPGAGAHGSAFFTGFGGLAILRQLLKRFDIDFLADGVAKQKDDQHGT